MPSCHFWLFNLACKNRKSSGYEGLLGFGSEASLRDAGEDAAMLKVICSNLRGNLLNTFQKKRRGRTPEIIFRGPHNFLCLFGKEKKKNQQQQMCEVCSSVGSSYGN